MTEKVTIKLSSPIKVFGKDVSEVELRKPKGDEISKIGMPFSNSVENEVVNIDIKTFKVAKYFDLLGGFPSGTYKQLDGPDFISVTNEIVGFFGESDQKKT